MNPDLFEQLRAFLGPSRTASTPLPPVRVTAPAREMTMGPSSGTASVGDEPVLPRLAAELGIGMTPAGAAPDAARAIQDAAEGDWRGAAGNAAMAALGIVPLGRVGKGARKAWEAWHGSPMTNLTKFDDAFLPTKSGMLMAGRGHYVAGADPRGAGRAQASGYIGSGDYINYRGNPIRMQDLLEGRYGRRYFNNPDVLPEDEGGLANLAGAYRQAAKRVGVSPSAMWAMQDEINPQVRDILEGWANVPERTLGAQRALSLMDEGTASLNRGGLYRLAVDADKRRFLNYDAPLSEQPQFVSNALNQSGVLDELTDDGGVSYASRLANRRPGQTDYTYGGQLLNELDEVLGHDRETRNFLQSIGIEGIGARGGSYVVGDRMVPSRQYTIFSPERIRILEMLAAAGIVPAANALAQMREPTTPVPPEG